MIKKATQVASTYVQVLDFTEYCSEMCESGDVVIVTIGDELFAYGATLADALSNLEYEHMKLGQIDPSDFNSFVQTVAFYRFSVSRKL